MIEDEYLDEYRRRCVDHGIEGFRCPDPEACHGAEDEILLRALADAGFGRLAEAVRSSDHTRWRA